MKNFVLTIVLVLTYNLGFTQTSSVSFESLTGKSLHELIHTYKLRILARDNFYVQNELQELWKKIDKTNNQSLKNDFHFLKTIIVMKSLSFEDNLKNVNAYKSYITSTNYIINYPYLAKLELLEAFCHFYKGNWKKALTKFEISSILAKEENDLIIEAKAQLYADYVLCYTLYESLGLKRIKELYDRLCTTNIPYTIEKDINLIQIEITELIFRFYKHNKEFELDTLTEYQTLHKKHIKKSKNKLAYVKMYLMEAYIAGRNKKFEKSKIYLDSARQQPLDFYNKGIEADILYLLGDYNGSIKILESFSYFKTNQKVNPWTKSELNLLANAYGEVGNYKTSNKYYKDHIEASNQLNTITDSISSHISKRENEKFQIEFEKQNETKTSYRNTTKIIYQIIFSLLCLIIAISFLFKRKKNNVLHKKVTNHKKSSILKKETMIEIIGNLELLEKENFYLSLNCNAYNTAKKINTNTTYLSKAINAHHKKSFNDYINTLRIEYILEKLSQDKRYKSYSIESLTKELGYKSSDSFRKAFKKHTGSLPSEYLKTLN